jgi:hypothetical protein
MINCAGCKHWSEIRNDLGYCLMTRTWNDQPDEMESRAVAVIQNTGGKGIALLMTHRRFTCSQFSRRDTVAQASSLRTESSRTVPSPEKTP